MNTASIFTQGTPTKNSHFGSGQGPVLLNDVACNPSYTHLSQCVHSLSIGIHECTSDSIAGVTCPEIITFSAKSTTPEQTRADETTSTTALVIMIYSIPQAVIFGVVGGALAVGVIILAALVLVVVVIKKKDKENEE